MFVDEEDVIKSVRRVFEILEWFDRERRPINVTSVAHLLGYPISSTNALLKSMSQRGYLAFDPTSRDYLPTLQLTEQSAWLDRGWYGRGRLRALVEELHDATGETITLSCQNDLEMLFVDVAEPFGKATRPAKAGDPAPLFSSSIGAAALSRRPDREITGLVRRYNRRSYRTRPRADPAAVMSLVSQARTFGHCIGYGLCEQATGAIAWPLISKLAGPPIVLAIAGPCNRVRASEMKFVAAGRAAIRRFSTPA